ncbi:hypothetical protein FACS1894211_04660 [Clostridia bacterium]|nr:hypothetical protein FACS1894211_04660 [Clostridia bacterium]
MTKGSDRTKKNGAANGNDRKTAFLKRLPYRIAGFALLVGIWAIVSVTRLNDYGVVPTPWRTLVLLWSELGTGGFYKAVGGTLWRSLYSFLIAFAAAAVFAVLAHLWKPAADLVSPFATACRAMPTIAVILILLLVVGGAALPAAVAFLVVFPLCYENVRSALDGVDRKLLQMADAFGVSKGGQIWNIYLPGAASAVFSSVIASFGLNIKVVIAAEILGLPTVSIGYMLLHAKQSFDFELAFVWLIVAVLLGFLCECLLRLLARYALPWKKG